ncbi:MAG: hypothetical protein OXT09_03120, partial [Myxococcales bacterium]|nr:hypothetical protein [Myxococcales bacterium]
MTQGGWTRGAAALLLGWGAALAGGCEKDDFGAGTVGEEGEVEFSFQRSCFFGCPLEQPLLVGARERIEVSDAGDGEGVEVRVSDPEVLEVALSRDCFCERRDDRPGRLDIAEDGSCDERAWRKHCDNNIDVEALAAGESFVILEGPDGEIDRAEVLVREADRAEFEAIFPDQLGTHELESLELGAEDRVEVEVFLYEENGLKLLAPEGVTWRM